MNLDQETERVILVGVSTSDEDDTWRSLKELKELAETAGAGTVGTLVQNRGQVHPGTYIGKGKIEELKDLLWELDATGIICDDELTPAQMKNLQDELDTKVMDRTLVILDIFAARASTSEGKLQVELAQLKYRQTRLTGYGTAMSRLGGGIGTRGPGEKKLEVDRRLIKSRIARLNRELKDVKRHREVTRELRSRNHVPVAAIVGYTNAGKSTLMNALTGAGILAEDKLFATLDPTARGLELPDGRRVMLIDTVGLLRRLPHHLVEAFKATLEELEYADLLLHVIDSSSPQWREQAEVVDQLIHELGADQTPRIEVFNKCDLWTGDIRPHGEDRVSISAKTGEGVPDLLAAIGRVLDNGARRVTIHLPYDKGGLLDKLYLEAKVESVDYGETIDVEAVCTPKVIGQLGPLVEGWKPRKEFWED